ncbi:MAG: hypothetical protein ACLGH0_03720 [Thermoanaerobaculia bacterium]
MGLWRSLFGGKREAPAPEQQQMDLFIGFLQASLRSWDDGEQYVESHPEILDERVLVTLASVVVAMSKADYSKVGTEQGEKIAEHFGRHFSVLLRCREVGVARAFDEARQRGPSH